jgi:hypothetical protein
MAERCKVERDRKVHAIADARSGGVVWPSIVNASFGLGHGEDTRFNCWRPSRLEES